VEEILGQARRLGKLIAQHSRTRAMQQASAALRADADARSLLDEHHRQAEHIRRLESEGRPIEVADKHKLADLEIKVAANPLIMKLMKAQADYVELMQAVNSAIGSQMGPETPTAGPQHQQ
jgi:cell fate (sporulation/competence/biofilm development) regulator YlbF (YheA/YmcA/DUF963 family)